MEYIEIILGVLGAVIGVRYFFLNIGNHQSNNLTISDSDANTIVQINDGRIKKKKRKK